MEIKTFDKKIIRVNEVGIDACGTSLAGYITITHAELVKTLGKGLGAGDKTLDEWELEGEIDGKKVVATIYDWKNYGQCASNITDWHIGGIDGNAVELVKSIFPTKNFKKGW